MPQPLAADLDSAVSFHSNDGAALSAPQLAIVDDFLAGRLTALGDLSDKSPQERYARPRAAIRRAVRHDDLYAALKAARPPMALADDLLDGIFRAVDRD